MKKLLILFLLGVFLCGCGNTMPKSAYDKLDGNEKIAYKVVEKGSVHFKKPASIQLVEAKFQSADNKVVARISAENSLGGHNTKIYTIKENGDILAWDSKEAKKLAK